MTELYKFMNSTTSDLRTYKASDFADYFGSVLSTGLLHKDNVPGMSVSVEPGTLNTIVTPGKAIMKGHLYENTTNLTLTHDIPEPTMNRIDRIVLRLDLRNAERNILLHVKTGLADDVPIAPALQRDTFIYEISLAQIIVRANTVQLLQSDLIDERFDDNLAGLTISLISGPLGDLTASAVRVVDTEGNFVSNNVEGALSELFTYADNMSQDFTDVIGLPVIKSDPSAVKKSKVQVIKDTFASNLTTKGQQSLGNETLTALVNKVANIQTDQPISGEDIVNAVLQGNINKFDAVYLKTMRNKLTDPSIIPTGAGSNIAISNDDVYLAVRHSISPFLTIYKRSGDVFSKVADPVILPANSSGGVGFSTDGVYLAVTQQTTPYIVIYKREGDVFTKLANPATLPTGSSGSSVFSHNGDYLTVTHANVPYFTTYKRSGDVFTKLANPSGSIPEAGLTASFSPDDIYMAVAHGGSLSFSIYKRSGDVFTRIVGLQAGSVAGSVTGSAFSMDGSQLFLSLSVSPYIAIFKRNGDVFTQTSAPSTTPTGTGNRLTVSGDGKILALAHNTAPFITLYRIFGDTLIALENPSVLPTGSGEGVALSINGMYTAVATSTTPFVSIYKGDVINAYKSMNILEGALPNDLGYAKESGTTGQVKQIARIWR